MTVDPSATPEPADTGSAAGRPEHTVLIVDDSPMDRLLAQSIVHKLDGWKSTFAANGVEALAQLEQQTPDVVLTDLQMPEMDGLKLVQAIRSQYPLVPVILMTAHGSEDIAIQALQKGAASYVPKNILTRDLAETLEQVLSTSQTDRNQRRILDALTHHETHFELENDPALVAPLVGHLEECIARMKLCEPSGLILLGVALHEALTNAIFHGNLELSSDLKEADEQQYYHLARERRDQDPYRTRRVTVTSTLGRDEAVFVVRDEGGGFDPALLPDPTDPANLAKASGRGLLLIQTFMDHVEHNDRGNQITMVKRRSR
jgi:CheY-like chemotaxis protein/anti-sigma regulatory factor (Ser/Thr protein kinase)